MKILWFQMKHGEKVVSTVLYHKKRHFASKSVATE